MPLDILEDSFHLLRQLPASAWVVYLTGAIPFLFAVLFTGIDPSPSRAVADAFLCAALFVWMQVWKARFASMMRAHLSAEPTPPWTSASTAQCLALQCSLQSVKLIAVPLAGLVLIPFAWTVAFFRNITALAFDRRLNGKEVLRASARFATASQRPGWAILSILTLLGIIVFLNIGILLAVLPGLLQSFTGTENAFTRGTGTFFNFTFLASTAGLTWLALDPLLQAVYTRLCFDAESRLTGADLLARLRRLSSAVLLIAFCATCASAEVPPDRLEQSIGRVLEGQAYTWKSAYDGSRPIESPPYRFLTRLADSLAAAGKWTRARFTELTKWLRDFFRQGPVPASDTGQTRIGAPLRWTMYALLAVITAGVLMLLLRTRRAAPQTFAPASASVNLTGDEVAATDLPEDRWIELAHECLGRGEYRLALRALYLANLAHLGHRELLTIQKSKTNRDYERELRRRSRSPDLLAPFRQNLLSFECSWYGNHPVAAPDIQLFEQNFAAIRNNHEA